ncbi:hypothetical protein [Eleftheria terrae]|uniref:hypothetical protein n=1 Tax=Eleftheria terrae TaxID=1597781 RepID=UPI00263ACF89|nr:hypothetical protein [Eleftheria terrae]WKB52516.1 hypothetical protein N7L95_22395 [Eleftheria terrae]
MKAGAVICTAIFVTWIALALGQLWLAWLEPVLFVKISVTLAGLFVVCLAVTLVCREYVSDQQMKRDGFID